MGSSIGRLMIIFPSPYLAEPDTSLLALAQGAKMYKLTRPNISTENIIDITGGRCVLAWGVTPRLR